MVWEDWMVLERLSGGCEEAVWRVLEVNWRAWENYLEGVGRLYM